PRVEPLAPQPLEGACHRGALLGHVATAQLGDDRVLPGEELVERGDVHSRARSEPVGGQLRVAVALENVSRRLQQRIHRRARTLLARRLPWRKPGSRHGALRLPKGQLTKYVPADVFQA